MKIIRPQDVVIKSKSDFDWDGFVDTFDWGALYESCSVDAYGYIRDDDEWGFPVFRDGYRLVSLNLPLTSGDMKAIREKCGHSFFRLESARPVFKLIENMLFVVDDKRGFCLAIVRFEPTENGYLTVEFLEDTEELRVGEPISAAVWIALWLSDLLPAARIDFIEQEDWDQGFWWKEAGDPEHEPSTKLFRSGDIAVLPKSNFDWDRLLASTDWSDLYRICSADSYHAGVPCDIDHRIAIGGYRIVALDLPLTSDDMKAIDASCRNTCSNPWGAVHLLIDNLFYISDFTNSICCTSIIRFEKTEAGYRAVEYIENTQNRVMEAPIISAARIAELLHGRLPGRSRFGWIDKDDPNQGWYWRDAGNFLKAAP